MTREAPNVTVAFMDSDVINIPGHLYNFKIASRWKNQKARLYGL